MADANAIYPSSLVIYYSSTHCVLFDHHYYLLLIISVCFILFIFFSSHISLLMADANAIYHSSLIMYYSSTHFFFPTCLLFTVNANFIYHPSLITYYSPTHFIIIFLINTFFSLWMVDARFIFILVFFYLALLSFHLASIQLFHPMHGLFGFILCYRLSIHFSSCSSHTINTFFLSSCTRNLAHSAVNTRSQSLLHRKGRAHAQYGKCILG